MICICTSVNRNVLYSYCQNNALTVPFLLSSHYPLWDLITWQRESLVINRDIILATRYFFCQTNQKYQLDRESAQFESGTEMHFLSLNTHFRE